MQKFPCAVESVGAFPLTDKEETSFFHENCTFVCSELFLDNYFFIRPENLKTSLKM